MKGRKIECQTVDYYSNYIYILTRKDFDLLAYNQETNKVNYVAQIDGLSYYTTSCIVEDKIFFMPVYSNKICEYNITLNAIRYIPIEIINSDKPFKECWACAFHDGYIYVACGSNSVPLVKVDPRTYEAESISEWNGVFEEKYGKQAVICSKSGLCIANNELWLSLNEPNVILQYNLVENTYIFHELQTDKTLFYTLNCDAGNIWLTGEREAIYKWNLSDNTISILSNFPSGFKNDKEKSDWKGLFYAGFQNGNDIFYIPLDGNMIIKCDKSSGELKKIGEEYDDKYCFHAFQFFDGKIYAEFDTKGTYSMSESVLIQPHQGECISFGLFRDEIDVTNSGIARNDFSSQMVIYKERYKGMLTAYINTLYD